MKIKLKCEVHALPGMLPGRYIDVVTFPDGDSFWLSKDLAGFLMHCEMLGLKLNDGFTIDDGVDNI